MMRWNRWNAVAGALLALSMVGCGGGDGGTDAGSPAVDSGAIDTDGGPGETDAGDPVDAGTPVADAGADLDAGPVADGGATDAGAPIACPPESMRDVVPVSGTISTNTTWTCDHIYELRASADGSGPVFVAAGTVLTIQPGTLVRGQVRDGTRSCAGGAMAGMTCTSDAMCTGGTCMTAQQGVALVVTRGARLDAVGTAERPIVFTSSNTGSATAPRAGDWGGVVLLGSAPTNFGAGEPTIEGLPPTSGGGAYGGADAASNCGHLSYVRIEYAGFVFGRNNELNGLTVGGCGTGTQLDHVQVYKGLDDGIEFFGGSVNAHHLVVVATGDDSLDWDFGFTGNVQFFIAQQRNVSGEDRCIEADNHPTAYDNAPLSNPNVYNFTCVGAGAPGVTRGSGTSQDGAMFRRGTAGTLRNSIFLANPDRGIQIDDGADLGSGMTLTNSDTVVRYVMGQLTIENNLVFGTGSDAMQPSFRPDPYTVGGMVTTTAADLVTMLNGENDEATDPMLVDAFSFTAPDFRPAAGSAAASGAAPVPGAPSGFFVSTTYRGAVDPAATGAGLWYAGWTRWQD